ncbi:MAG: amidohydrolase [Deltaproteobacteria bacterium]|nr:amidohydrolase [Deltaproteobacteria bacterium]
MKTQTGNILFHNGNIITADEAMPRASVLAAREGRIVYVGESLRDAARLLPQDAETVDLCGGTMVPGLADSHQHFMMQGEHLAELDIHLAKKEAILRMVADKARELSPGEWILGRGWSHEVWLDRQWPCKEELDAAAPDNPVALTRLDGHSLWANSAALRAAGLDRNSPEYPGGEILRREDGELTGVLVDTPAFKIRQAIPPQTEEQKRASCLRAQADMFRYGITSVGDAWQMPEDHALLKALYAEGALHIRIYGMLSSRFQGATPCADVARDPVGGLCGDRLSLKAYKIVLDGSLGSRSAWLTGEYADRPGHSGNHRYTDEDLLSVARAACAKGFQLCIHAIGDAAVLQAVTALETLHRENTGAWLPHRIEHFQTASPPTVARALAIGVIPSMQTIHALADKAMAQVRLTSRDLAHSYPWRDILDQGGIIANGSDSPMDGVNPFHGFYAAISRTPFAGQGTDASRLRMTRDEALKSYTLWAARAEMAGAEKGSLAVGKHADCAVLDRDIMTCPEEDVKETRVLMTVVAGETVYGGPELWA